MTTRTHRLLTLEHFLAALEANGYEVARNAFIISGKPTYAGKPTVGAACSLSQIGLNTGISGFELRDTIRDRGITIILDGDSGRSVDLGSYVIEQNDEKGKMPGTIARALRLAAKNGRISGWTAPIRVKRKDYSAYANYQGIKV